MFFDFHNHNAFLANFLCNISTILTDGIYVRVYEDRMDLLRAVIVGAYGTPYQDGLFFFDFHLPPEYPEVPPVRNSNSDFVTVSFSEVVFITICLDSAPLILVPKIKKMKKKEKKILLSMVFDMACYAAVSLLSFWWVADKSESVRGRKGVS